MTTVIVDLPPDIYAHLQRQATRQGKPVEVLAQEWLAERSSQLAQGEPPAPADERERAIAALRDAGLLTALSPEEKARAAQSTLTLEDAQAILDRAGGKPLSDIILEMRGPKE